MTCKNPYCKAGNQARTPGNYWKCGDCDGKGYQGTVLAPLVALQPAQSAPKPLAPSAPVYVLFSVLGAPQYAPCTSEAGALAVVAWLEHRNNASRYSSQDLPARSIRVSAKAPKPSADLVDHPKMEAFALRVGYQMETYTVTTGKRGSFRSSETRARVFQTFRKDQDAERAQKYPLLPEAFKALLSAPQAMASAV